MVTYHTGLYGLIDKSIAFVDKEMELNETSVWLEAEKKGFDLSTQDRKYKQIKVDRLQDQLYGPRISDVPAEKKAVCDHLASLHKSNGASLDASQHQTMTDFLSKFDQAEIHEIIHEGPQDMLDRKTYSQIFVLVFRFYEMYGRRIEFDDRKFVSVSSDKKRIFIPNRESYDYLSIKRVCELIDHEIGTHAGRAKNMELTTKSELSPYLHMEEGLAVASEKMVSRDIDELDTSEPTIHHITTFIAEQCNSQEALLLLQSYFRLIGEANREKQALSRLNRIKRHNSHLLPGANRKDTVYWRGLLSVVKFLRDNPDPDKINYEDLITTTYLTKMGEPRGLYYPKILDYYGTEKEQLYKPLWLGQILYRKHYGKKYCPYNITKQYLSHEEKVRMIKSGKNYFKREILKLFKNSES